MADRISIGVPQIIPDASSAIGLTGSTGLKGASAGLTGASAIGDTENPCTMNALTKAGVTRAYFAENEACNRAHQYVLGPFSK